MLSSQTTINMDNEVEFADFDEEYTFKASESSAALETTTNFVVEFGENGARIAFNCKPDGIERLLKDPAPVERPVRWM